MLKALSDRGNAKVLISYEAVLNSSLYKACEDTGGTIWGFEHVRMPFVYAAHNTAKGKHPVRMWEMWAVINATLQEKTYLKLLMDPDTMIEKLIDTGKAAIEKILAEEPLEYAGVREEGDKEDFVKAFEEQCRAYLLVLAGRAPAAKWATATIRGMYEPKYLGTLGCIAGLWWAHRENVPVYYCLDGLEDKEIINFKTNKTDSVNAFLANPKNSKHYVEVITLGEIREILLNWTDLKKVVKFCRKGEFLPEADVVKLIEDMKTQDDAAAERLSPLRQQVIDEANKSMVGGSGNLPDLNGPLFADLTDDMFHRVVAQLLLLNMATLSRDGGVLRDFLQTKGAEVLYEAGILPGWFGPAFRMMVDTEEPTSRKMAAHKIIKALGTTKTPRLSRTCC
ncbi:hypothetical protein ACFQ1L_16795 [Phytohabitans flavus]|uniref:hypothetical protein n=1 Tax=Phytohabitans flavus TaxID=1076124 RepID=UPI0036301805